MLRHILRYLPGLLMFTLLAGCTSYRKPDQQQPGMLGAPVVMQSRTAGFDVANEVGTGLLVPNANGGTMLIPGAARTAPNPLLEEAYELKVYVRELAAQLLETRDNQALVGLVAMPTSFLNLNDFNESSALGRYLGEAMFYEFNQRNFPVREYRLTGSIALRQDTGEIALSRALPPISTKQAWAALLIGTYQRDAAAVFVNVRLVRPADGMVLRTAQMVFPLNDLMKRMVPLPKPAPLFKSGSMRITS